MAMTRRAFGALIGAAGAAWLAGAAGLLRRAAPARTVRALRARFFPGKVRPLDGARIRTPGKWLG